MTEFAGWHRAASEALISAAVNNDHVLERLDESRDCGQKALLAAVNARERMLAMGLLMTVEGLRSITRLGLETERVD